MDIPKIYNPKDIEQKWYDFWMEKGYFEASPNKEKKPYTIVIPPPNVTGTFHVGHAFNNVIQDIYIRWKRMQGFETEWLPGMDHAGIGTQVRVEKSLPKGMTKEKLGREKFLEKVWEWTIKRKSIIIDRLKKLGCSCDWTRQRFTLDETLSNAVKEVFVRLHQKGYIYRDSYIVNWCPGCKTALSDEEVEHEETKGKLYYINYPIKGKKGFLTVATTRPETMLGDTALAVNPDDKKNKIHIGKNCILPLIQREIPVIGDGYVDPKFGTGIVKVTPAHDLNDFEIGKRHNLPEVLIMDETGKISENGGKYKGMDRFEAREAILSDLSELGLLADEKDHPYSMGHCYRCHSIIEPYLSRQWFVRMQELAKPAIEKVEKGEIKFYPDRWTKNYLNWMYNIKDWCISRQIWWGHRLPVYYCKNCIQQKSEDREQNSDKGIIVSKEKPDKCPVCGSMDLEQEQDVLDTWFSSWLWPFSTFGWPEDQKTEDRKQMTDLDYFYPTELLVTAPEIIFFWVARMIMAGLEFTGDIPFKYIYIHGTVRDEKGIKMSNSLGNAIDAIEIIDNYGADALRFSLIAASGEGQDPYISYNTFELGRNFTNKIWNAYRLIINLKTQNSKLKTDIADRWIVSREHRLRKRVKDTLENYRINEAVMSIYEFFWHELCDWYLEIIKISKRADVAISVLENTLKLLHPFIPFITEEIWQGLKSEIQNPKSESIMISEWPEPEERYVDDIAESSIEILKSIVTGVRNTRTSMKIPQEKKVNLIIRCSEQEKNLIQENEIYINKLGGIENILYNREIPKESAIQIEKGIEIFIPVKGLIDIQKQREKLAKEREEIISRVQKIREMLLSSDFIKKAPSPVIEKTKEKEKKLTERIEKIEKNLEIIKSQE